MRSPYLSTIKRLYALSRNRCAFEECTASLIHEGKVTGRICHIKGAKPGAARYDRSQSDEERHGFQNLILMCPIHHDVIDADEGVYTVDLLIALKATHEARSDKPIEISDGAAGQFLTLSTTHATIINQNVTSTNQSGGITAHTVNVSKPRRIMGGAMKSAILAECPRDKPIVVWSVAGDEETHTLAQEIFTFMRAHGFDLFGDGPQGQVYLGAPPKGVELIPGQEFNEVRVGHPE